MQDSPVLICMKGHPGCGKSSLARSLAQHYRAALVDKDDVRDCCQGVVVEGRGADVDWNTLSYNVMLNVAAAQLRLGLSVVIDCPLAHVWLYDRAVELAQQCHARLVVVEVGCGNEAEWRSRLEARGAQDAGTERAHKPGSWDALQATLQRYKGCYTWSTDGSRQVQHHVRVDTAGRDEASVAAAVRQQLADMGLCC
mmetsp:Transcript_30707/g.78494  ORF Transcript_30707/g.78494 Transcript_30707/m.78494 type:complete len:197 (-) Transcript_30707:1665-2255(-)